MGGNRVSLLHDGAQCFPAMLEAIASAQEELLVEMYWFGSDRTGWRFAEALMDKARRGVPVYVIYDAVGSYDADRAVFDAMRAAGCRVHEFHPIAPWRHRFKWTGVQHRDHRKIVVVDGRVGFTGGLNFADEWASPDEGGQGFRDDMIRVEGPAALQMRELFWRAIPSDDPPEGAARPRAVAEGPPAPGDSDVLVIANDFRHERRAIRQVYLAAIAHARRHIVIANSYFIPDRKVRRALRKAVERGVRVRVLVPGQNDVAAVQYASRALYSRLLKNGIEIYEWGDTVLHSKSAAIDDRWSTVGTYNLDYRSWRMNLEVNVVVKDADVAVALRHKLEEDIARSRRVWLREWRYRPLLQRGLERFFYYFRKLL